MKIFRQMISTHATATACLCLLCAALNGCASTSYGTKIDPQIVAHIQKGRSTRAEVEAMLGRGREDMMPGGGRMLSYMFSESKTHANADTFIPIFNTFHSSASGTSHSQTLQIMLDKNNVVEDYVWNDDMAQNTAGVGLLNMGMQSTSVKTSK